MQSWSEQTWDEIERAVSAVLKSPVAERWQQIHRNAPAMGCTSRIPVLQTLVKVEIESNWQLGKCLPLEAYLEEWPELEADRASLSELIEAECRARLARTGDVPDVKTYRRRFPKWTGDLDLEGLRRESRLNETFWDESRNSLLQSVTLSSRNGANTTPMSLSVGAHLDRYRVLSPLGKGAMGSVYLAKDGLLDRLVAIKILHTHVAQEATLDALCDEARAAAKLKHPSIVPVYDVGVSKAGTPYLVMAFIEGESLAKELSHGPLPIGRATLIARQLAGATAAAHQAGFAHRDIKPANILIDLDGDAHLTDFGLAIQHRLELGDSHLAGTPAYMSPEQLHGKQVDHRSDIWSLGVVLFEMLTHELPFQGESVDVLKRSVVETSPKRSLLTSKGVQRSLVQACLKCLKRRPEDRFQSARELESALEPSKVTRRAAIAAAAVVAGAPFVAVPVIRRYVRRSPSQDFSLIPWIEDCKLGLAVNIPGGVDLDHLERRLRMAPGLFFDPDIIELNASRRGQYKLLRRNRWLCLEMPLALRELMDRRNADALSIPNRFEIRLRVAVSEDGRILLGTMGEFTQHHLPCLTPANGVSNFLDFRNGVLSPDSYDHSPKDYTTENSLWQTSFGLWVRSLVRELERQQIASDAPRNHRLLRDCPARMINRLGSEITVVTTCLYSQQFTHEWLKDEDRELVNRQATGLWSPIADDPTQHVDLTSQFRFRIPGDAPSALMMQASTDGEEEGASDDEYNDSMISVRGTLSNVLANQTESGDLASISLEHERNEITAIAQNTEVSSAFAIIYDLKPHSIRFQAKSTYSFVRPIVRFATLGSVEFVSSNWSPRERSNRPIEPLFWRIPEGINED